MGRIGKPEFYLLVVTAVWGLTFPLIGTAVKSMDPVDFVFLRFFIAAAIILPFVWNDLKYTTRDTLKYGFILGVLNLLVYSLQSIGLTTIGSAESAFLTAVNVILVPFFLLFFKGQGIKILDFVCSGICLLGLYILTGAHFHHLNMGELYTLLGAVFVALSVIAVQFAANKMHKFHLLVFYQILFTALGALPFSLNNQIKMVFTQQIIFSLLFCAVLATVVVLYMQLKFQKFTTASKAALIYSAEPLFACVFAWLINHETITLQTIVGGAIIFVSMIFPDLLKIKINKIADA